MISCRSMMVSMDRSLAFLSTDYADCTEKDRLVLLLICEICVICGSMFYSTRSGRFRGRLDGLGPCAFRRQTAIAVGNRRHIGGCNRWGHSSPCGRNRGRGGLPAADMPASHCIAYGTSPR